MLPAIAGDFESAATSRRSTSGSGKRRSARRRSTEDGKWFGFDLSENQKQFFFLLAILVVATVVSKNIIRSRTGRALQAIRDRDIAAEVMGVPEFKYKLIGFAISSFFAGIAGALFASFNGQAAAEPVRLVLSVEFIAILLIGGVGTIVGTLIGTFFVVLIPEVVKEFTDWLGDQTDASPAARPGRRRPAHQG